MIEKLIEHLSKEIQIVTETTVAFRTRIAFIVWIGPFVVLSSIVVATKGVPRFPHRDIVFDLALVTCALTYMILPYMGGRMEKQAWQRCDTLRQKIIEYAKLKSADSITTAELDYPAMTQHVRCIYMWAFGLILILFVTLAIAVSRLEVKSAADDTSAVSNRTSMRSDSIAPTSVSKGKLDLVNPDSRRTNEANQGIGAKPPNPQH